MEPAPIVTCFIPMSLLRDRVKTAWGCEPVCCSLVCSRGRFRARRRTFCSVSDADIEDKLTLLVPLYDVEGGGMDLSELTQLIVKSVQGHSGDVGASRLEQERREMGIMSSPPVDLAGLLGEGTVGALEEVWHEVKEVQEETTLSLQSGQPQSEYDSWAAKTMGISAEIILRACRERPAVRAFLEAFLHADPIRAKDGSVDPRLDKPTVIRNFYHRLMECETEVFRKVTLGSEKPVHSPSRSQLPPVVDEARGAAATATAAVAVGQAGAPAAGAPPPGTAGSAGGLPFGTGTRRSPPEPLWVQRGAASVAQTWSTTALVRRKHGQHTRTELLTKHQFATRINEKMPKRNSLTFAELVEPQVLHKFLNKSRSDAGLPPLHTRVEHLLPARRGASSASLASLARSTGGTSSAATL